MRRSSAVDSLIFEAGRRGILPLTSVCNTRCVFCSHRQNPPGVESYYLEPRLPSEVAEGLDFLGSPKKIVIGESATRIMEGEPFTHPRIMEILEKVRGRFPETPIEITTNATLIDTGLARRLAGLGGIHLVVSLNALGDDARRRVMDDRVPGRVRRGLEAIGAAGIKYDGSLVAMPWITGWDDFEAAVLFLAGPSVPGGSARTVRVFIPGYTRLAPQSLRFPPGLPGELIRRVGSLRLRTQVPLVVEPPRLADLDPVLAGSIPGSAAREAGLTSGCVIVAVDGRRPRSRVEAFRLLEAAADPRVRFAVSGGGAGDGGVREVRLSKAAGAPSGAVFEYDIDPEQAERAWRKIINRRAERPHILTSELARDAVAEAMTCLSPPGAPPVTVEAVPNRFFGGSIGAAGLLTAGDFLAWWEQRAEPARSESHLRPGFRPDLILIPGAAFDARGRDLTGRSYFDLEETFGVPVEEVGHGY